MQITRLRKLALTAFVLILTALPLAASETEQNAPNEKAFSINRALIKKFEDYRAKALETYDGSPQKERELSDMDYKIKALKEDLLRMEASLPPEKQANEFLQDLVIANNAKREREIIQRSEKESSKENEISLLHEKALQLVENQNYKEAIKTYEEIVLRDPDDDQAYMIMGHNCIFAGEYEKAEIAFQNAVHIDSENWAEIVPFYQNIVLQNPASDSAHANLGYAYLIVGEFLKAKSSFSAALEINPESVSAQMGLEMIRSKGN